MDSDTALTLPQGVTHQKQPDCDIITWSNLDIAIDKAQIFFTLLSPFFGIGSALFFTLILVDCINDSSFLFGSISIIAIATSLAFIVIPFLSFPQTTWRETIKISDEYILLTYSGLGTPKKGKRFSKKIFLKLVFEAYGFEGNNDLESYPVLYILYASQFLGFDVKKKEQFAIWMNKKDRYQIFLLLQQILKERHW